MYPSILKRLICLALAFEGASLARGESARLRGRTLLFSEDPFVHSNRKLGNGNGNSNANANSNANLNSNANANANANSNNNNGNGNAYAYGHGNGNSLVSAGSNSALLTADTSVTSGQCMQDVFNMKTKQNTTLSCKKETVHLENVASLNRATCTEGETIVVDLKASMVMKGGRYDVGWYFATDGGNAKTGTCLVSTLQQGKNYAVTSKNGVAGSVAWDQDSKPDALDKNDACGDVFFSGGGGGTVDIDDLLVSTEIQCVDKNNDGNLDFGICFSFRTSGNDDKCDPSAPFPGDTRTCNCARYDVPQITVEKVAKSSAKCY